MKKIGCFFYLSILLISCYKESLIPVKADFSTQFVNKDESVPVTLKISNATKGAETYDWEFEGGNPATSKDKNPSNILYSVPGTYTIKLTAKNSDGESDTYSTTVVIKDKIDIRFTQQVIASNYAPVVVKFTNTTTGVGLSYHWSFQDGSIATFDGHDAPNVTFSTPGNHTITLEVSNGFESFTKTTSVTVAPWLVSKFSWKENFEDDDYQAPVTLNFIDESISTTNYNWSFSGGTPATATTKNPTITFTHAGTYQISLIAANDKTAETYTQTVTILPDTNLRILNDLRFGINSAHNNNTTGAFYAIQNRQVYTASSITTSNSSLIDIAFQGLNSGFTYNKFISPNQVQNYGFLSLSNAQTTIFINSQELCACGLNFTVAQFDAMTNDTPLQSLTISSSDAGAQEFGNTLPRIVLFKTQDGRKGAIKVKQMVQNGSNSYLICDVKVQKQ